MVKTGPDAPGNRRGGPPHRTDRNDICTRRRCVGDLPPITTGDTLTAICADPARPAADERQSLALPRIRRERDGHIDDGLVRRCGEPQRGVLSNTALPLLAGRSAHPACPHAGFRRFWATAITRSRRLFRSAPTFSSAAVALLISTPAKPARYRSNRHRVLRRPRAPTGNSSRRRVAGYRPGGQKNRSRRGASIEFDSPNLVTNPDAAETADR